MNKKFLIITFCLIFIIFIVGCQTRGYIIENLPQSLQLSRNDITIGEVLTAELYYSNDKNWKEQLITEALKGTDYDFLLMPRYEIFTEGLITKVKVQGRGAKVK